MSRAGSDHLNMLFFRKDGSLNWLGKIAAILGILLAGAVASMLSGCLSVVRIPFPTSEKFSDEGVCTNRVWASFVDQLPQWRVYTTVKMRCHATKEVFFKPIPEELKGEKLYKAKMTKRWAWIPLTIIWATSPFDAAIDTLFLPWDLWQQKQFPAKTSDSLKAERNLSLRNLMREEQRDSISGVCQEARPARSCTRVVLAAQFC